MDLTQEQFHQVKRRPSDQQAKRNCQIERLRARILPRVKRDTQADLGKAEFYSELFFPGWNLSHRF